MKRIFLIIFLIAGIGIGGCKKDNMLNKEDLLGKWNYVKAIKETPVGGQASTFTPNSGSYFEFMNNGDFNLSLNGGYLTIASWAIINNKLLISSPNTTDYIIKKVNNSELIYYREYSENGQIVSVTTFLSRPYVTP